MFEGCPVDVTMKEMMLEGGFFDETVYPCTVSTYDADRELLYLFVNGSLPVFSLDARYTCRIDDSYQGIIRCEGYIRERYWSRGESWVVLQVDSGFYKNRIN